MGKETRKLIANNKKAWHDYFIEEKYEAGIELVGTEVKSVRQGHCSIKEAFIRIDKNNEVQIYGMHINADFICQLAYRWKSISFMILLRGNAVYNLIAKLDIQCLVTVKINLYCHL